MCSSDLSAASTYTDQVGAFFESRETFLDGRRLGMIRRALVALTAVHRIQGRLPSRPRGAPADLFRHGLETTLPFRALGRPIGRLIVDGAHHHAISSLSGAARRPLAPVNLLAAVRSLLASPGTWDDPDTVSLLVTRVSAAVEHPTRVEAAAQAGAALVLLAGRPDLLARARPEARHRLLSSWRETASLGPEQATEFASKAVDRGFESRMPEAVLAGSQRIAFRLAARLDRLPSINCNYEDFGPKLLALVEEGVSP